MTGFREKMGLSRAGGLCGILLFISTTTTLVQAASLLTWTSAKAFQLFSVLPLLLLYNPFCSPKSESKIKVNHIILLASHCF